MNKYAQEPSEIIDLHGYTTLEAEEVLLQLRNVGEMKHVRIIVGKGTHGTGVPILGDHVRAYLASHRIRYRQAKLRDGGAGALEVFFGA